MTMDACARSDDFTRPALSAEAPAEFTPFSLQSELARLSGRRIQLELNANRSRVASVRREEGGLTRVRLQRAFLASPPEVLRELADMIRGGSGSREAIRAFAAKSVPAAARPPRSPASRASAGGEAGRHHDIRAYADGLNRTYLGGRSTAEVMWGRKNSRKGARSIRFACFDPATNRIIMNRKLDSQDIPGYFVECILFHEMLHEVLGIGERPDGRRDIHGSLFKLMETTHPDYEKAQRFEKELCERLWSL